MSTLAGGGVALRLAAPDHGTRAAASDPAEVQTTAVTQTDLSTALTKSGNLGYGTPRTVKGAAGGRITLLPANGATIQRGQQLYRVNDRPTAIFYGATPLFRRLDTVGTVGRDVRVVADNLQALGYTIGAQPTVGTLVTPPAAAPTAPANATPTAPTGAADPKGEKGQPNPKPSAAPQDPARIREGDAVLTPSLIEALKQWQRSTGMTATGILDVGDLVVTPGPVRVADLKAQPGDDAAGELLSLTGTEKVVTVPVATQDSASFQKGQTVTVDLPDGSTATGKISAVSTVIQSADEADGTNAAPRRTVTIQVDEAAKLDRIDAAPVQVQFTGETKQGVLAVPVGALVALSEGGYAVQLPDSRLIKVTTGMFAKGLVEVSGSGIIPGLKVVTTS
ncbi:hypothetical protein ACFXKW_36700 [Streptomyces sp. NPDC059193]|uniref:hypothetical protein n=1 Tax=Streptomyces sp. NPDC059193 TaxID=3346763 RepID=UPI00369D5A0A